MFKKLARLLNKNVPVRLQDMVPPAEMIYIGGGDFLGIGQEFVNYFIRLGDLRASDSVLDVGCGIGRMAVPLTQHLSKEGRYEGFDIVPQGINWCREQITARYSNFRFQLADIRNTHYNPDGKVTASNFRFPYADEAFDFIFLVSVFTHMLPADLENYLSEISRTLKPDGRCFVTFFLLNDESLSCIGNGFSSLDPKHERGPYRIVDEAAPETTVCYDEQFILNLINKYGL